jgi:lysophospholipase L1-like esterase
MNGSRATSPVRAISLLAIVVCAALSVTCSTPPGPTPPTPTPLSVSCPSNVQTRAAAGSTSAEVTYTAPVISGGIIPVQTQCTPQSGSSFPVGTTSVECRAVDSAGSATCSFSIVVDPPPAPPRLSVTTFMAFGDSLTEGKVSLAATPWLLVESPSAYTLKLQSMLGQRYAGQDVLVINEGLGGKQASDPAELVRLDRALDSARPPALLLLDGANDLLADPRQASVFKAADGIEDMVEHAKRRGIFVFVASLPPQIPNRQRSAGEPFVVPLNQEIKAIAEGQGVTFVDVYAAFNGDLSGVGSDGLHLNDAGYETVARAFYDAIVAKVEAKPAVRR